MKQFYFRRGVASLMALLALGLLSLRALADRRHRAPRPARRRLREQLFRPRACPRPRAGRAHQPQRHGRPARRQRGGRHRLLPQPGRRDPQGPGGRLLARRRREHRGRRVQLPSGRHPRRRHRQRDPEAARGGHRRRRPEPAGGAALHLWRGRPRLRHRRRPADHPGEGKARGRSAAGAHQPLGHLQPHLPRRGVRFGAHLQERRAT